ncbi:MAG: ABC transporter permease, partial [Verrucomicrobiota bacterium]|nr:ABC transporter permease [Verrucomicrobiota bacterium]
MKKSLNAIAAVAHKEFLHIWRDRRIMVLILCLPPMLTFIFGHAFEVTDLTDVPAILEDRDHTPESEKFVDFLDEKQPFHWRKATLPANGDPDLLREKVPAALVIPPGWGRSLSDGDPIPIEMTLDGADTMTAAQLEGAMKQILGDFQMDSRQE